MSKVKIYEKGLDEYPKPGIIIANLLMALWVAVGAYLCDSFHPAAGWVYLASALLMIIVIMRKLVCANCWYYGKWCSNGWGKLSALMFKQGEIEKFAGCAGIKIAPFFYGLLTLIPLLLGVISLISSDEKRIIHTAAILFLLALSAYSGYIGRKKSCSNCKMRLICPGSAVK
jgi:hypothetical protein